MAMRSKLHRWLADLARFDHEDGEELDELARRLNAILKSEVERVKEEAKLTTGLCAQVGGF